MSQIFQIPLRVKIACALYTAFFGIPGILLLFFGLSIQHAVPLIFGLIMCACGWIPLYIVIRKYFLKKQLLQSGEVVMTKLVEVNLAYYDLFGWRPYIIKTQWLDPMTNLIYHFKSPALNYDPSSVVDDETIIPVYIDRQNPKHRYYMDVSKVPALMAITE